MSPDLAAPRLAVDGPHEAALAGRVWSRPRGRSTKLSGF